MASVKEVRWSKLVAEVGETVEVRASVVDTDEDTTVTFSIGEYTGIPPQLGGGSKPPKVLRTVVVPIAKGATQAIAHWTVELTKDAAVNLGIPEFQVRAHVGEKGFQLPSKLLKLGTLDQIRWLAPKDEHGNRPPAVPFKTMRFSDRDTLTLSLRGSGLSGFSAELIIRREPDDPKGEWKEIARIRDVTLHDGSAEVDWKVPEDRVKELAGGELVFDVELHHPATPRAITSTKYFRSNHAKHAPKVRIYFTLAYEPTKKKDHAFERAASTWADSVQKHDDKGEVRIHKLAFTTSDEFAREWKRIATELEKCDDTSAVVEAHIFSHSSDEAIYARGLVLEKGAVEKLTKLRWDAHGTLVLHGCYSGVIGEGRDYCVASVLAKAQGVRTIGQVGYAYFSESPDTYVPSAPTSSALYLWAFNRGEGKRLGDGSKLEGAMYR